ncbi:NAD(P)H-binding protein [Candidatus Parcubacteria bacterium]|nr:NAD(P)H-binding protein [Candidatus Parcubacteria bacterium]
MTITVFGANGKVGRKVVERLLAEGHSVKAFIHSHSDLKPHPKLELLKGDVHRPDDVKRAVKGSDVVVSALGSWGTKSKDILSSGMAAIIPAMQQQKVKRIVSLTGAAVQAESDKPKLIDRLSRSLLKLVASQILRDGERHLALLEGSGLDWTVLRSPVMREKGKTGYKISAKSPLPWATINRNDVADAMASLATNNNYLRSAPFIKRNN